MKFVGFTLVLAGILAANALGQTPTVGGLLNNYSNTLPGLPNYGIAQGSIFDIYGTNFAAAAAPLQAPPLQSTLSGVTISVTVGNTTTHPLFYYLGPTQIDAVLPSATPTGTGTLTVTTSAGTSAPFTIVVVASAFGLLTTNNGSGPVQGFDASNNYALFSFSTAVNPGEILELWGTGLGPVAGDATDAAVSPTAQVYIGGIAADVIYAGRSSYVGLDQINIKVPSGISGCYVSVVVQTGTYLSNFGTLPITASGRTCSDTNNPLTGLLMNGAAASGSFSIGVVSLSETTTPAETIDGITISKGGTTDGGFASFLKITYSQLNAGAYATASVGSCVVSFYNASVTSQTPPSAFTFTYLNAGPDVNINGPDGAIAMPLTSENDFNFYTTPTSDNAFIPAAGGTFTFNNGSGGPDVGAFTAQLQLAAPLVWTNANSVSPVTRSAGLTVTWTGGDPSTYVGITGLSQGSVNGSSSDFVVGSFTCEAPASAGKFTVPSAVLLSLPASATVAGISFSSLSLSNVSAPVTFKATGLDIGMVEATSQNTVTVTYQ